MPWSEHKDVYELHQDPTHQEILEKYAAIEHDSDKALRNLRKAKELSTSHIQAQSFDNSGQNTHTTDKKA